MGKQLTKGNEAIVKAAVLAGCRAFYGYPITPASEIAEAAARYLPAAGGVFVQAESEVAAINMLYGGAAAGVRAMTASSGPGISLMQEGFSYLAGAETALRDRRHHARRSGAGQHRPRAGRLQPDRQRRRPRQLPHPGAGSDSVQEMADLTSLAFDLADRYRNPAVVLADGFIGQMMEPVEFAARAVLPEPPDWAVLGTAGTRRNLVSSIHLEPTRWSARPQARGQVPRGRTLRGACRELAHRGRRDRPGGLRHRGPSSAGGGGTGARARACARACCGRSRCTRSRRPQLRALARTARAFAVVELSTGQMVDDVRLALDGRAPVELFSRVGGKCLPRRRCWVSGTHLPAITRSGGPGPCLATRSVTNGAQAFYTNFERKGELPHQTHYCPGCGHGIVHKLLAAAIDGLGVRDRTVLISPVGCSVFAYYYFDIGNMQAAHGRAPAVATAIKRSRPDSVVVAYQGDGDLAAIGTAEIIHAANRGESMTVIFVNNGIYGMTGGQMAPTTPLGKRSTTSPLGRDAWNEGYPIHVCELLDTLEAPVYIERVALGDNKQIMHAAKAIRRALEYQVTGLGFSFVEVLSPCPTIWKLTPVEAQKFVRDEMASNFAPGCLRDRGKEAEKRPRPAAGPALADLPGGARTRWPQLHRSHS